MARKQTIILLSVAALLLAVLAVAWLALNGGTAEVDRLQQPALRQGSNPTLDVRFTYDANILRPALFDSTAEYPLRLDHYDDSVVFPDNGPHLFSKAVEQQYAVWSLMGKRIRGLGKMLGQEPGPLLYDFVGSTHVETFEQWYGLAEEQEPFYDDAVIGGKLALFQKLAYRRTAQSTGWPGYFPESIYLGQPLFEEELDEHGEPQLVLVDFAPQELAYLAGWVFYRGDDLFFFYAVAPEPLTQQQLDLCVAILNSLEYNAVLGELTEEAAETPLEDAETQAEEPAQAEPDAVEGQPADDETAVPDESHDDQDSETGDGAGGVPPISDEGL